MCQEFEPLFSTYVRNKKQIVILYIFQIYISSIINNPMCCIQIQCIKLLHDSSASQIVVPKQFYWDYNKIFINSINVNYPECLLLVRKLPMSSFLSNPGHSDTHLPCLFQDISTPFLGLSILLCFGDICVVCLILPRHDAFSSSWPKKMAWIISIY